MCASLLELEREVLNDVNPFFGGGNGRNQQNIINHLTNRDSGFHHEHPCNRFAFCHALIGKTRHRAAIVREEDSSRLIA